MSISFVRESEFEGVLTSIAACYGEGRPMKLVATSTD